MAIWRPGARPCRVATRSRTMTGVALALGHAKREDSFSGEWFGMLTLDHVKAPSAALAVTGAKYYRPWIPSTFEALSAYQRSHPNGYGVSTNSARYRELTGTNQE